MTEAQLFKTSAAALGERRQLLRDLRFGLALALLLGCVALGEAPAIFQALAWGVTAFFAWGLWRFKAEKLLEPYASRQLRLQDNALELTQGRFTRLLFFNQLEQLRMIQGKGEKVLAIELRTLDGAVLLRGYETMEALFSALNARKPARVLIEIEETPYDYGSVTFWRRAVFSAGASVLIIYFLLSAL